MRFSSAFRQQPSAFSKILQGILKYDSTSKETMVKKMAVTPPKTNDGQALMITCVDARLSPTQFTDCQNQGNILYIARNPGNFIPPIWVTTSGASTELAALDLVVVKNEKRHVLVCGHSTCKAMNMMYRSRRDLERVESQKSPILSCFHSAGRPSLEKLQDLESNPAAGLTFIPDYPNLTFHANFSDVTPQTFKDEAEVTDLLSKINVLQQLENITTHNFLVPSIMKENLVLHALWYHIATGDVYYFNRKKQDFVLINQELVNEVLQDELHM